MVEFAIAAPVLITLLLGIYDMGHWAYLTAALRGAVNQAARGNALETANTTKADAYVESIVKGIAPDAKVVPERLSYYDFADIARPESWNDRNGNGTCDRSEPYVDENRNGRWDADIGVEGNGGASDVVLYKVSVTYTPVFFIPFGPGKNTSRTVTATAVKKNQPHQRQDTYSAAAGTCS